MLKFALEKEATNIQKIENDLLLEHNVKLYVKRDDLLHPKISGNKWRKLKYNLLEAEKQGVQKLLTFGGAYSNHISAVAAAGKEFGFETIGIIRGERIEPLNSTLSFALECGMHLHFVSRTTYREKYETPFLEKLKELFGSFYLLPEGGTNNLALKGCTEIVNEVKTQFKSLPDYFCAPCGTGGTIGGIISGMKGQSKVMGFSALKGNFLQKEVATLLKDNGKAHLKNWTIQNNYHFGGYAKYKMELIDFINDFKKKYDIPLDPLYTGKTFFGIFELIKKGYFEKGTKILAIHTGGLQGVDGFNERYGDLIL